MISCILYIFCPVLSMEIHDLRWETTTEIQSWDLLRVQDKDRQPIAIQFQSKESSESPSWGLALQ